MLQEGLREDEPLRSIPRKLRAKRCSICLDFLISFEGGKVNLETFGKFGEFLVILVNFEGLGEKAKRLGLGRTRRDGGGGREVREGRGGGITP